MHWVPFPSFTYVFGMHRSMYGVCACCGSARSRLDPQPKGKKKKKTRIGFQTILQLLLLTFILFPLPLHFLSHEVEHVNVHLDTINILSTVSSYESLCSLLPSSVLFLIPVCLHHAAKYCLYFLL